MRSEAGHTLIEVIIGTVVLAMFFGGSMSVLETMYAGQRDVAGYTRDLDELGRALERLEDDLRHSRGLGAALSGDDWHLDLPGGGVRYRLQRGCLTRHAAGRVRELAHCIHALEITEVDGRYELALQVRPRRRPAQPAMLFSAVPVPGEGK